jgi:hypothetical protein
VGRGAEAQEIAVRRALPIAVLASFAAAAPARAYRPFDETDAAVAETREFELELGPLGYTHDEAGGAYTPGFILNYGAVHRLELVFDAHHSLLYGGAQATARRRQLDTALLAKFVAREGCLQGGSGLSVAVEGGPLLPTLPAAGGAGLSFTTIVSQRWSAASLHVNVEGDVTRDHTLAFIGGAIVEGPDDWRVRPVAESYVAREQHQPALVSGLGGAIWRVGAHLDLDAAFRAARQDGANVYEARAGLTWSIGL